MPQGTPAPATGIHGIAPSSAMMPTVPAPAQPPIVRSNQPESDTAAGNLPGLPEYFNFKSSRDYLARRMAADEIEIDLFKLAWEMLREEQETQLTRQAEWQRKGTPPPAYILEELEVATRHRREEIVSMHFNCNTDLPGTTPLSRRPLPYAYILIGTPANFFSKFFLLPPQIFENF